MRYVLLFLLGIVSAGLLAQNVGQVGDTLLNYKDINGLKQGKWIKKHYSGEKMYEGYFVDDLPRGLFLRYDRKGRLKSRQYFYGDSIASTILFYPNGDTISTGRYYNKKKDSIWNYYNEDGKILMTESYKKGVYHGNFIYYYPDGQKWQFIHYTDGKKDGIWKRYYTNGQPMFEASYKDGLRQDTFTTYYENGQIEVVVPYVNDLKHGDFYLYDEQGNIIEQRKYINGVAENQDELDRKESQEIDKLLQNRGKFKEPYDEGSEIFRSDQY
jgi:antitoxin component YwqK of YwqJK toxin-antitoxin module